MGWCISLVVYFISICSDMLRCEALLKRVTLEPMNITLNCWLNPTMIIHNTDSKIITHSFINDYWVWMFGTIFSVEICETFIFRFLVYQACKHWHDWGVCLDDVYCLSTSYLLNCDSMIHCRRGKYEDNCPLYASIGVTIIILTSLCIVSMGSVLFAVLIWYKVIDMNQEDIS